MQGSGLRAPGQRAANVPAQQRRSGARRASRISASAQDPLLMRVARGEGESREMAARWPPPVGSRPGEMYVKLDSPCCVRRGVRERAPRAGVVARAARHRRPRPPPARSRRAHARVADAAGGPLHGGVPRVLGQVPVPHALRDARDRDRAVAAGAPPGAPLVGPFAARARVGADRQRRRRAAAGRALAPFRAAAAGPTAPIGPDPRLAGPCPNPRPFARSRGARSAPTASSSSATSSRRCPRWASSLT
jgi:hypothetical protein